jgi:tetratricopeptide (TPR) repeat protein
MEAIHRRARRELGNVLVDAARSIRHPRNLRVLFLDGYEYLCWGDKHYEAWAWQVWGRLLQEVSGLRIMVAGREAPRPHLPAERPNLLRDFTPEESATYLIRRGIESVLCFHFHELTGGHPLLLWMVGDLASADIPLTLHDMETVPETTPDHLPVTAWLYARILDRLPKKEKELAETVALLRRFDMSLLNSLLPEVASDTVLDFVQAHTAWLRPHQTGGWAVHDMVGRARAAALKREGPEFIAAFHEQASVVWLERWRITRRPSDFAEYLYHTMWFDEKGALQSWEQVIKEHSGSETWQEIVQVLVEPRLIEKPLLPKTRAVADYLRGRWHASLAEWQTAEDSFRSALNRYIEIADAWGEAKSRQSLGDVFMSTEQYDEAMASYEKTLDLYRTLDSSLGKAQISWRLGNILMYRKCYDKAMAMYKEALVLLQNTNSPWSEAKVLQSLGDLFTFANYEHDQAAAAYEKALRLYQTVNDRWGVAITYLHLGNVYVQRAELDQAMAVYNMALVLFQELGFTIGEGNARARMADIFYMRGEYQQAVAAYQEALSLLQFMGDHEGEIRVYIGLGGVYEDLRHLRRAEATYKKALSLSKSVGSEREEARAYIGIGNIFIIKAYYGLRYNFISRIMYIRAIRAYIKALELSQTSDARTNEANALSRLGYAYGLYRKYVQAEDAYREALVIFESVGASRGIASVYLRLGDLFRYRKEYDRAEIIYEKALTIHQTAGDIKGVGYAYTQLGRIFYHRAEYNRAVRTYYKSIALYQRIGLRMEAAQSLGLLGQSLTSMADYDQARIAYQDALSIFRTEGYWPGIIREHLSLIMLKIKRTFHK